MSQNAPNSEIMAIKIVKWIIALKKNILLTFWRMQSQLQVFLLVANFKSDRVTSHNHGLQCSKVSSFEASSFRIAGTSEAKLTLVGGKADCLLAIGKDKKLAF